MTNVTQSSDRLLCVFKWGYSFSLTVNFRYKTRGL
jgi:hypothetical protein